MTIQAKQIIPTKNGYRTADQDHVGTYDHYCGGDDGTEAIKSYVFIGEDKDADADDDDERWAVIDIDADAEGPGVVSRHATRDDAWGAALVYLRRRKAEEARGR